MKNLKTLFIILCVVIAGCKKETSNSSSSNNNGANNPPTPTSLTITITDDVGSKASGASVYLYSSLTDLNNRANQVGSTGTTDANGNVTFSSGMGTIKYYFWTERACLNNIKGINSTSAALTGNVNNTVSVQMKQTGTLKMSSNSSNPYEIYINGVDMGAMPGYADKNFYYQQTGSITVRVLQLSGYALYPTDKTYYPTIACGTTTTVGRITKVPFLTMPCLKAVRRMGKIKYLK